MATANLVNAGTQIIFPNDSIVIVENIESVRGGRTLNVTGFTPEVIQAGHVLIEETATGDIKPMPLNAGATAYEALPADHTYYGILNASIPTNRPFAGILVRGTVNQVAAPFDLATILAAVKAALPLIRFVQD